MPHILTFEEEEKILAVAPPFLRALVILILETGMRSHREALPLMWEAINFANTIYYKIGGTGMATQLCQGCKQAHPGRVCDYDEKGECTETIVANEVAQTCNEPSKDEEDRGR
jgi:integrase